MTKLDEKFVESALKDHPQAAYFINTLAEEVRRLEELGGKYESTLKQIAGVTYGTEVCNSSEENNEILARHFFYHQRLAKEALS